MVTNTDTPSWRTLNRSLACGSGPGRFMELSHGLSNVISFEQCHLPIGDNHIP